MDKTQASGRSPLALAMRRFLRMGSARFGLLLLLGFFFAAIYAPFLSSEVALLWWDEQGLSFPVLEDIFNRNSYNRSHHLLFNTLALALPLYLLLWWILGRFAWRIGRRIPLLLFLHILIMLAVSLPLRPPEQGRDSWRAIWQRRPQSTQTWRNYRRLQEEAETTGARAPRALFAPVIHNYKSNFYAYQEPGAINPDTGVAFWWGSDDRGQDVLSRMIFGSRISLTIGIVAVGISMLIGITLGAISGYFGGWVDLIIQRIVEIMMAFPTFILVLVVVAMWGRDIYLMMLVFGLTGWAGTTRLVRGEFLAQANREYVLAAEALGLSRIRIMFRHILPNTLTPLLISAAFGMAGMVLAESGLAFIGMGDDSVPSWGSLLDVGRQQVSYAWLIWIPGLAIFTLVTSLNLLGNALREALDPRNEQ